MGVEAVEGAEGLEEEMQEEVLGEEGDVISVLAHYSDYL